VASVSENYPELRVLELSGVVSVSKNDPEWRVLIRVIRSGEC